jgi:hypothetical protein
MTARSMFLYTFAFIDAACSGFAAATGNIPMAVFMGALAVFCGWAAGLNEVDVEEDE